MFGFRPEARVRYSRTNSDLHREDKESQEDERHRLSCDDLCGVRNEWLLVFDRLDQADGLTDGRIDRRALVKWVSALDLQKTIEFEANLNITPRELERLVSRADRNKDGYVDRHEFLQLVANRDHELTKKQQSLLRQYLRVAAYAEEYSCWPPPVFVPTITLLQLLVYLYHVVHFTTYPEHAGLSPITWSGPEPVCSRLIFDPGRRREAWRYISYCLVHVGVQHVLLNLLMQLFVGLPLEASHGAVRVGFVYFAGVLAGSLTSSAIQPAVFLAGASGGVYALIAAHLATLVLNWREDIVIMRRRFRAGKSTSAKHGHIVRFMRLLTVVLYGALDFGLAVYHRRRRPAAAVKTSYAAHLAGAASGLLVGIIVLKNRRVEHWETCLKVVCVILFAMLMLLALVWNIVGNRIAMMAMGVNATYFEEESYGDDECTHYI